MRQEKSCLYFTWVLGYKHTLCTVNKETWTKLYLQQVNKTHLLCLKAMSNSFLNTCSVKNPGISTSYGCIYLAIIKGKFKITTCPSIKWTALHLLNVCFKGVGYGKVSKSMSGKTKQILMFHQLSSVFQS